MNQRVILLLGLLVSTVGLADDKKELTVKLTVPDAAWSIVLDEIHQVKDEIWVVSTVSRDPNVMGAQRISTVQASVELTVPDLPVKHFVIGKTWGWQNEEPYMFLKHTDTLTKQLIGTKQLYQRSTPAKEEAKEEAKASYFVVYHKELFTDGKTANGESLEQIAKRHCREFGGSAPRVLKIINGFAADFPASGIEKVKQRQEVNYVERD